MYRKLLRGFVIGGVIACVGLVFVGEARPFGFGWLFGRPQPTVAMAPVCNPCAQGMTAGYVPQTSYRVQYVTVPVTTYRPVVSTDPCTGCQTTCMRPATCYQQQARYVPYTSYRIVYAPTQPACAPATTAYYAATTAAAPVAAAGCSSCGVSGAAQTTYYAPSVAPTVAPGTAVVTSQPAFAYTYPSTVNYGATMTPANVAPTPIPAVAPSRTIVGPTVVGPTGVGPSVPSSATPIYSGPTYMAPSNGAILSSPTVNGDATVQPSLPTTTSLSPIITTTISPNITTTSSPVITTTTTIVGPTFAPPAEATSPPVETKSETQVERSSTDALTPIPDPLSQPPSGPSLNKTSLPRLFDPQDKTAAAWPVEQAWSYAPVNPPVAAKSLVLTSADVPGTTVESSSRLVQPSGLVERKRPAATPIIPPQPAIDADGWRSASK
jgi:hypothetical protein